MPMTSALDQQLLAGYLSNALWLSLHRASPTKAGSHSNEVSSTGTAYARQPLSAKMNAPDANGLAANSGTITFPTITADYGGPVTWLATESAVTGGTMGFFNALTEASLKSVGQAHQFTPNQISIQLD